MLSYVQDDECQALTGEWTPDPPMHRTPRSPLTRARVRSQATEVRKTNLLLYCILARVFELLSSASAADGNKSASDSSPP